MSAPQTIVHPIPPFCPDGAEVLILGSFPSVKSREVGFFYGHPQNRFWRVLGGVYEDIPPVTVAEKQAFLTAHRIALWDVIASCRITGSSDSSIRDAVPNNLAPLLCAYPIRAVYVNGKTAYGLYQKYILPALGTPAVCLPSTSPANAAWSLDRLTDAWHILRRDSHPM